MRTIYRIFIVLLLAGNCFAVYKLTGSKAEFFNRFPQLTRTGYRILCVLPLINIAGLFGMLFYKIWAASLVMLCAMVIILMDVYFGIYYHLYLAVPSTAVLLFFILANRKRFT